MIEWKEIDSWPFYVDQRCTIVGVISIDKSKGMNLFRLRVSPSNLAAEKAITIRINKGTLNYGQANFRGVNVAPLLEDLPKLAELLHLKVRGVQKTYLSGEVMTSHL